MAAAAAATMKCVGAAECRVVEHKNRLHDNGEMEL